MKIRLARAHPGFFLTVVADVMVWLGLGLAELFGPDQWFAMDDLSAVNAMPDLVWGGLALGVAGGIVVGLTRAGFTLVRVALAVGVFVATLRLMLIGLEISISGTSNISLPLLWMFFAITMFAQVQEPPENPLTSLQPRDGPSGGRG